MIGREEGAILRSIGDLLRADQHAQRADTQRHVLHHETALLGPHGVEVHSGCLERQIDPSVRPASAHDSPSTYDACKDQGVEIGERLAAGLEREAEGTENLERSTQLIHVGVEQQVAVGGGEDWAYRLMPKAPMTR